MRKKLNIASLTDKELLIQYNTTLESHYFGELYNRYIPLIYGLSLKYLKDEDKAKDAVMQIFENILPKIPNYEINNFKTWIYSVAKNHCLQELRADKKIFVDFNVEIMESPDFLHLLSEENDDESKFNKLEDCLRQLPVPQRLTIELFFLKEKSYADIVEETQYQLKSVKSYIQNGKRNLKNCIEKFRE